ncbi:PHD finger protein 23B-like isoform X2 [Patiria miniata]|uniref:PHD finger protein 13 n=1 Tax=Patiria miniata TaxID=46514 RepID=A0A913ZPT6_PATMI|nr:PHD finger protein 23B-like isoform X2 [Patiria miniata]
MSSQVFSVPVPTKRPKREYRISPSPKKRKTMTDFNTFCTWVLDYEASLQEEGHVKKRSPSPLDSEGNSTSSSDTSDIIRYTPISHGHKVKGKDEEWELVTCYCLKPFAGRPMIECSECSTWIHLSCAKIRKNNVPDVFTCQRCRDSKFDIRRSNRAREPKKQFKELYEEL